MSYGRRSVHWKNKSVNLSGPSGGRKSARGMPKKPCEEKNGMNEKHAERPNVTSIENASVAVMISDMTALGPTRVDPKGAQSYQSHH
jgi:hypothetical protein